MKKVVINDKEYEIIVNHKEAFDEEEFLNKCTDYFYDYDYIVGDIAYSKLRLKGFYDEKSKNVKSYNNIKKLKRYINENCAYGCKYFVLQKENDLK